MKIIYIFYENYCYYTKIFNSSKIFNILIKGERERGDR